MGKNKVVDALKSLRKQVEKERKAEAKLAKLRESLKQEQRSYREDHRKLAAAIAALIRDDDKAGEDPHNSDYDSADNGFHWFQNAWGNVVVGIGALTETNLKERDYYDPDAKVFEVTCPTTGCVAGWATSLAGFPMAVTSYNDLSAILQRNEGDIFQAEDCIDKENNVLVSIADKGAELLQLDSSQREWLFSGHREHKEVLWALDQIAQTGTFDPYDYCSCSYCRD